MDSDQLCADWLLINERKELAAFPSQPIRLRQHPSCEGLREVRSDRLWFCFCPDSLQTSSQQTVSQRLCSVEISLLLLIFLVEGSCWSDHRQSLLIYSTCIRSYMYQCDACRFSFHLILTEPLEAWAPLHTFSFPFFISLWTWVCRSRFQSHYYPREAFVNYDKYLYFSKMHMEARYMVSGRV